MLKEQGGRNFSALKAALIEATSEQLGTIGTRMKELQADTGYVEGILADGSARARAIASPIVREVRKIVGFVVS